MASPVFFTNRERLTGCLSSLALALVLFVLMPFGTFHLSADEFQAVGRLELLSYATVALLASSAAVAFLFSLARRFAARLFPVLVSFAFALAVLLYAQGNLIGLDYGLLDGHPIDWDALRVAGLVNSGVWVLGLVALTGLFHGLMRRRADAAALVEFVFLCYLLILVSCCFCFAPDGKDRPARLADDNLMELSRDRNMVVFVVDSFDRGLFDLVLDRHPDVRKALSGFTYFHNTVGRFPATVLSLPQLVSGHRADPAEGGEVSYRDQCYADAPFLEAARRNGFEVDLYVDPSVGPRTDDARRLGCFGNVDADRPSLWSLRNFGVFRSLLRVSLFRYLPHALKPACWDYLMRRGFSCANADGEEADVRTERLLAERLASDRPFALTAKRKVKIYHVHGVHVPKFNAQQALSSLGLVRQYAAAVARAGLADRTSFVVLGDHGVLNRSHPILLCSNGGDAFREDSRPVSYRRMDEIWSSALTNRAVCVPPAPSSEMRPSSHDRTTFRHNFIEDETTDFRGRTLELIRLAPNLDTVGDCGDERIVWDGQPGFLAMPIAPSLSGGPLEVTLGFESESAADEWSGSTVVKFANGVPASARVRNGRSCSWTIPESAVDPSGAFVRLLVSSRLAAGHPFPILSITLKGARRM